MSVAVSRRLFTVDQYHEMACAGILSEDDRVELLDGEIVEMSPIGSRHSACVNRLTKVLDRQIGETAILSVQNPIRLGPRSEPQPDLALLRPRPDFYANAHPGPKDVLLIIEVAEPSAEFRSKTEAAVVRQSGHPRSVDLGTGKQAGRSVP